MNHTTLFFLFFLLSATSQHVLANTQSPKQTVIIFKHWLKHLKDTLGTCWVRLDIFTVEFVPIRFHHSGRNSFFP